MFDLIRTLTLLLSLSVYLALSSCDDLNLSIHLWHLCVDIVLKSATVAATTPTTTTSRAHTIAIYTETTTTTNNYYKTQETIDNLFFLFFFSILYRMCVHWYSHVVILCAVLFHFVRLIITRRHLRRTWIESSNCIRDATGTFLQFNRWICRRLAIELSLLVAFGCRDSVTFDFGCDNKKLNWIRGAPLQIANYSHCTAYVVLLFLYLIRWQFFFGHFFSAYFRSHMIHVRSHWSTKKKKIIINSCFLSILLTLHAYVLHTHFH